MYLQPSDAGSRTEVTHFEVFRSAAWRDLENKSFSKWIWNESKMKIDHLPVMRGPHDETCFVWEAHLKHCEGSEMANTGIWEYVKIAT